MRVPQHPASTFRVGLAPTGTPELALGIGILSASCMGLTWEAPLACPWPPVSGLHPAHLRQICFRALRGVGLACAALRRFRSLLVF